MGCSDYTILIPLDLSREQMQEVERLMGKGVNGDASLQEDVMQRNINDAL
jgi:hypothetical protein